MLGPKKITARAGVRQRLRQGQARRKTQDRDDDDGAEQQRRIIAAERTRQRRKAESEREEDPIAAYDRRVREAWRERQAEEAGEQHQEDVRQSILDAQTPGVDATPATSVTETASTDAERHIQEVRDSIAEQQAGPTDAERHVQEVRQSIQDAQTPGVDATPSDIDTGAGSETDDAPPPPSNPFGLDTPDPEFRPTRTDDAPPPPSNPFGLDTPDPEFRQPRGDDAPPPPSNPFGLDTPDPEFRQPRTDDAPPPPPSPFPGVDVPEPEFRPTRTDDAASSAESNPIDAYNAAVAQYESDLEAHNANPTQTSFDQLTAQSQRLDILYNAAVSYQEKQKAQYIRDLNLPPDATDDDIRAAEKKRKDKYEADLAALGLSADATSEQIDAALDARHESRTQLVGDVQALIGRDEETSAQSGVSQGLNSRQVVNQLRESGTELNDQELRRLETLMTDIDRGQAFEVADGVGQRRDLTQQELTEFFDLAEKAGLSSVLEQMGSAEARQQRAQDRGQLAMEQGLQAEWLVERQEAAKAAEAARQQLPDIAPENIPAPVGPPSLAPDVSPENTPKLASPLATAAHLVSGDMAKRDQMEQKALDDQAELESEAEEQHRLDTAAHLVSGDMAARDQREERDIADAAELEQEREDREREDRENRNRLNALAQGGELDYAAGTVTGMSDDEIAQQRRDTQIAEAQGDELSYAADTVVGMSDDEIAQQRRDTQIAEAQGDELSYAEETVAGISDEDRAAAEASADYQQFLRTPKGQRSDDPVKDYIVAKYLTAERERAVDLNRSQEAAKAAQAAEVTDSDAGGGIVAAQQDRAVANTEFLMAGWQKQQDIIERRIKEAEKEGRLDSFVQGLNPQEKLVYDNLQEHGNTPIAARLASNVFSQTTIVSHDKGELVRFEHEGKTYILPAVDVQDFQEQKLHFDRLSDKDARRAGRVEATDEELAAATPVLNTSQAIDVTGMDAGELQAAVRGYREGEHKHEEETKAFNAQLDAIGDRFNTAIRQTQTGPRRGGNVDADDARRDFLNSLSPEEKKLFDAWEARERGERAALAQTVTTGAIGFVPVVGTAIGMGQAKSPDSPGGTRITEREALGFAADIGTEFIPSPPSTGVTKSVRRIFAPDQFGGGVLTSVAPSGEVTRLTIRQTKGDPQIVAQNVLDKLERGESAVVELADGSHQIFEPSIFTRTMRELNPETRLSFHAGEAKSTPPGPVVRGAPPPKPDGTPRPITDTAEASMFGAEDPVLKFSESSARGVEAEQPGLVTFGVRDDAILVESPIPGTHGQSYIRANPESVPLLGHRQQPDPENVQFLLEQGATPEQAREWASRPEIPGVFSTPGKEFEGYKELERILPSSHSEAPFTGVIPETEPRMFVGTRAKARDQQGNPVKVDVNPQMQVAPDVVTPDFKTRTAMNIEGIKSLITRQPVGGAPRPATAEDIEKFGVVSTELDALDPKSARLAEYGTKSNDELAAMVNDPLAQEIIRVRREFDAAQAAGQPYRPSEISDDIILGPGAGRGPGDPSRPDGVGDGSRPDRSESETGFRDRTPDRTDFDALLEYYGQTRRQRPQDFDLQRPDDFSPENIEPVGPQRVGDDPALDSAQQPSPTRPPDPAFDPYDDFSPDNLRRGQTGDVDYGGILDYGDELAARAPDAPPSRAQLTDVEAPRAGIADDLLRDADRGRIVRRGIDGQRAGVAPSPGVDDLRRSDGILDDDARVVLDDRAGAAARRDELVDDTRRYDELREGERFGRDVLGREDSPPTLLRDMRMEDDPRGEDGRTSDDPRRFDELRQGDDLRLDDPRRGDDFRGEDARIGEDPRGEDEPRQGEDPRRGDEPRGEDVLRLDDPRRGDDPRLDDPGRIDVPRGGDDPRIDDPTGRTPIRTVGDPPGRTPPGITEDPPGRTPPRTTEDPPGRTPPGTTEDPPGRIPPGTSIDPPGWRVPGTGEPPGRPPSTTRRPPEDDEPVQNVQDAVRPAPRPDGGFPRKVATAQDYEISYDPDTQTWDTVPHGSAEPVVTEWDMSMPTREEHRVGPYEVTPRDDGLDFEHTGRIHIPLDVRMALKRKAEASGERETERGILETELDLDTKGIEYRGRGGDLVGYSGKGETEPSQDFDDGLEDYREPPAVHPRGYGQEPIRPRGYGQEIRPGRPSLMSRVRRNGGSAVSAAAERNTALARGELTPKYREASQREQVKRQNRRGSSRRRNDRRPEKWELPEIEITVGGPGG